MVRRPRLSTYVRMQLNLITRLLLLHNDKSTQVVSLSFSVQFKLV